MKQHVLAVWEVDSFDVRKQYESKYRPYVVVLRDNGQMHCTCEAFRWGQGDLCKHIKHVVTEEPAPVESQPGYVQVLHEVVIYEGRVEHHKSYHKVAEVTVESTGIHIDQSGVPEIIIGVAPIESGARIQVYQYK